jgi:hypothetical protein
MKGMLVITVILPTRISGQADCLRGMATKIFDMKMSFRVFLVTNVLLPTALAPLLTAGWFWVCSPHLHHHQFQEGERVKESFWDLMLL